MSDHDDGELLTRAAAALRERTDGSSDRAKKTRARVLATHARAGTQRLWAAAAALLLALGLGVPTVWAWSTGRLESIFGAEPIEAPSETAELPQHTEAQAERMLEPTEPEPAMPPAQGDEAIADDNAGEIAIAPPAPPVESPELREDEPDVDPAERRAYRAAHDLHFEAHDPAGALGAWDGYIARYPRGRFALEARYNRALCLVRLRRDDEARAALTPFADGMHGGYRRAEATALIDAMAAP